MNNKKILNTISFFGEKFLVNLPKVDIFLQNKLNYKNKKYIYGSEIYYNGLIFSKNRSFEKKQIKHLVNNLKEPFVINDPCYVIQVAHGNLGHFLHDQFFHLYRLWVKEKRKVLVFIETQNSAATKIGVNDEVITDFLHAVIGQRWLVFCDFKKIYQCNQLVLPTEGRNLKVYSNYKELISLIKKSCIIYYGLQDIKRTGHFIYPRAGLERKRLLEIDLDYLVSRNIDIVQMHDLCLEDQIKILLSAKLFVSMVGAGVFNLIFMDMGSTFIEINPHQENSWALRFGLSEICNFCLFIAKKIIKAISPVQDVILDADVIFDDALKAEIDLVLHNS